MSDTTSKSPLIGGMNFDDVKLPGGTPQAKGSTKKHEPTTFWLNVGVVRKNAEGEEKLVTLANGIPLDGMQAPSIPGPNTKNQEFRNLQIARNQLHTMLWDKLATLRPGESVRVPFAVELRRIDEKHDITQEEVDTNPFALSDFKL